MPKYDTQKCRPELLDPNFLEDLAWVLTAGADKYSDFNWQEMVSAEGGYLRYYGALQRHALALAQGEQVDPESGRHHATHIAANAMILHWHDREYK